MCTHNGSYAVHVFIPVCLWIHTAPLSLHIHLTTYWICVQPSYPGAVCRSVFWRKVTFPLPASLYCWRILWWESDSSCFNIQHSTSMFISHFSYFPGIFSSLKYFRLQILIYLDVVGLHCHVGFLFWRTLWSCCAGSVAQGMQELSSLTRDRAHSPGSHSGLLATEPWKSRFPRLYHPTSFLAALLLLPLQQARMLRKLPSPTPSCLNHNQPPGHVLLMEDEP